MSAVKSACALQHRSAVSNSVVFIILPFVFPNSTERQAKSAMARATARRKASANPIAVNRRISRINLFAPPQQESKREQQHKRLNSSDRRISYAGLCVINKPYNSRADWHSFDLTLFP